MAAVSITHSNEQPATAQPCGFPWAGWRAHCFFHAFAEVESWVYRFVVGHVLPGNRESVSGVVHQGGDAVPGGDGGGAPQEGAVELIGFEHWCARYAAEGIVTAFGNPVNDNFMAPIGIKIALRAIANPIAIERRNRGFR